ncbi:phosphotransferase [Porticoccus sp.]
MRNIERTLQQTLSDWQHWHQPLPGKPRLVRPLPGGRTNHSFLVESGAHLAVVRVNAVNSAALGIDRRRELALLRQLQGNGFVPPLWYATTAVLVTGFVEGRHWPADALQQDNYRERLAQLVRGWQQLPAPAATAGFSYLHHCRGYLAQLGPGQVDAQRIETLAAAVDQSAWQPVICHHDLVAENIIDTERGLVVLDWEYGGWGHPAMDLVRLYGGDYAHEQAGMVHRLQQAMDALWQAVQAMPNA